METILKELQEIVDCYSVEGSPGIKRSADVLTIVANLRSIISKAQAA